MSKYISTALWLIWSCLLFRLTSQACNRKPQASIGDFSPVADNFQVLISGNPNYYVPGQIYTISVTCTTSDRFLTFTLVAENENGTISGEEFVGHFELIDTAETKFSANCENMVESTNINAKSRIDVLWFAPKSVESGCIQIKAAVLQHRTVWYMDNGLLTKRVCPEINEMNSLTPPLETCCAQDEAKYEIKIERIWSRNTHPKYFPSEAWRTRFSETIGASHSYGFRFWDVGILASQGLRELAEHGVTSTLEQEIKLGLETSDVRTIIKAPGVIYRNNALGTTLAHVRVDPQRHIISLVTKMEPSPDWFLGIAGLELCLPNCTWIGEQVISLYPWDAGTDSGPSYMSADQAQVPPDVVRRITKHFPSDHRSPFYDDSSIDIKPLATLSVVRKKVYTRPNEDVENEQMECATHPWTAWSECNTRCGSGTQERWRAYKEPALAMNFRCNLILNQTQACMGTECGAQDNQNMMSQPMAECGLGEWSEWTECSNNCGKGYATRTRSYNNPYAREKCQSRLNMELTQTKSCMGENCGGIISNNNNNNNNNYNNNNNNNQYLKNEDIGNMSPLPDNTYDMGNIEDTVRTNDERVSSYTTNRYTYGRRKPTENYPNNHYNEDNNQEGLYEETSDEPTYKLPPSSGFRGETRRPSFGGTREDYDSFGRKRIIADAGDPDEYAVVQSFCYELPVVSKKACNFKKKNMKNFWFYDADDRECKLFTTDSCDPNKNKFNSLENCESICLKPHSKSENNLDDNFDNSWNSNFGQPESEIRQDYNQRTEYSNNRYNRRRYF